MWLLEAPEGTIFNRDESFLGEDGRGGRVSAVMEVVEVEFIYNDKDPVCSIEMCRGVEMGAILTRCDEHRCRQEGGAQITFIEMTGEQKRKQ